MNWDDLPLKLTVPQAATALGISRKSVYRLAKRHELPHEHYGTALRFDRDTLRRGDTTCNHSHDDQQTQPSDLALTELDLLRRRRTSPRRCKVTAAGR